MTLRRNVGSRRSVLASSSVPARTRCFAGAMKSSGSSECATSTSSHQQRANVANKPRPPGYLYCGCGAADRRTSPRPDNRTGFSWWTCVRRSPCGVRCATCPSSAGSSSCDLSVSSATACSQPGSRGRSCSTRNAKPTPLAIAGRVRRAVPALFAAGPVRRCAAGPLGSAAGPRRGEYRPPASGARGGRVAASRRERSADPCRCVDRQRVHAFRLVRACRRRCRMWYPAIGW